MDNIITIVKETLLSLKEKNIDVSPLAYANEFYIQSRKINPSSKILNQFNDFLENLSPEEKKRLESNGDNTYFNIATVLKDRVSKNDVSRFVNHMAHIMSPSISDKIDDDIDNIIKDLSNNPNKLTDDKIINELAEITNKRIDADRNLLQDKADDVQKILSLMSKYFDKSLVQSQNTKEEVKLIKKDLKKLELSKDSQRDLNSLYSKLTSSIYELENSVEKSEIELIKGKEENKALIVRVQKLENDLNKARKDNELDYLTRILNRRAFNHELEKIEKKYKMFSGDYAIVFYDIDHFKDINDSYGHDCGDHILSKFASVLNKLTRVDDTIARYGGEEFVALVNYKNESEVIKYLSRVKSVMDNNQFPYKNIKVKLRFSAGVVLRKDFNTYEDAIIKADEYLYRAKKEGRNKIILKSEVIN